MWVRQEGVKDEKLREENKETEVKSKRTRSAFKVSLLYILVTVVWIFMARFTTSVVENLLEIESLPMIGKYAVATAITSIFVFFIFQKILKRIDENKCKMAKTSKELRQKEATIKIASEGLSQHRKLIQDVLESAAVLIIRLDKDLNIIRVSRNIREMASFEKEDIEGKNLSTIVAWKYIEDIRVNIEGKENYKTEIELSTKYGKSLSMYGTIKKNKSKFKDDGYYTFVLCDITDRKMLQNKVNYLDSYDTLTDLPNRNFLERTFISLLPEIDNRGNPVALLYIDIDDFNFINESKGYHAGDYLLVDMAGRLKEIAKETDIIARMSQDKFVVVFTGEGSLKDIDLRVKEILEGTKMEWEFQGEKYIISTTIGVSLYPKTSIDFFSLIKDANLALECAKEYSRTSYEYFAPDMKCNIVDDLSIVSDIKIALENRDFQMHYQPIRNLETGELENVESLIRWFHPEKGYISPADFIPVAEKTGIIDEIGEYTIDEVFRQKEKWNRSGYKLRKVSINISAISFSKEWFAGCIRDKLKKYNLRADEIVLELTESSFSPYREEIKRNIKELRSIGVEIAMDDFGTGYSSLARLKELEIDYLKLDRTFIVSLLDENGQEIIKPLISLANALGKRVIAEGIETKEQYEILKRLGCQSGQGYFLARPMPAHDLVKL